MTEISISKELVKQWTNSWTEKAMSISSKIHMKALAKSSRSVADSVLIMSHWRCRAFIEFRRDRGNNGRKDTSINQEEGKMGKCLETKTGIHHCEQCSRCSPRFALSLVGQSNERAWKSERDIHHHCSRDRRRRRVSDGSREELERAVRWDG